MLKQLLTPTSETPPAACTDCQFTSYIIQLALIVNFCLAGILMWVLEAGHDNPDYEVEGAPGELL